MVYTAGGLLNLCDELRVHLRVFLGSALVPVANELLAYLVLLVGSTGLMPVCDAWSQCLSNTLEPE